LWRNPDYKRLTGFSLVGLFSLSVLFSLRKRWKKLSFGDFEAWRVTHAAVGVLCLVGGFVHTGFRLGSRLDFALALAFLGSVFLGGLAGGWSLLEERVSPEQARALRGILIKSHIYFLWPLPVLLAVHVAKAYFF
jgi:nitrite reductase (NADH) large subunit